MIRLYSNNDIKIFKFLSKYLNFKEEGEIIKFAPKEGSEFFMNLVVKYDNKFNYKKDNEGYYTLLNKKFNNEVSIKRTVLTNLYNKFKYKNLKIG